MTDEKLDEIEARANAASDGPWLIDDKDRELSCAVYADNETGTAILIAGDSYRHEQASDNCRFAGHARTDIPDLVSEIRQLRADLEWLARYHGDPETLDGKYYWCDAPAAEYATIGEAIAAKRGAEVMR
jgi:hypothetical protein